MKIKSRYDVIIVGGSYAGLSAAMALGRSLRSVLIVDSGLPCNRQTPHAHNFITQDGATPAEISRSAREQVLRYPSVTFLQDLVTDVDRVTDSFTVKTENNGSYTCAKILFATGLKDVMPEMKGFADCWGISVLHCPYCHGYEVSGRKLGIIASGEKAMELCNLIRHWSDNLTLFSDGPCGLTSEELDHLNTLKIAVVEKKIEELVHREGYIQHIAFQDDCKTGIDAVFSRVPFILHCDIPVKLGCELTEEGCVSVDSFQKTSVEGVFAAGDTTTQYRALPIAIAAGMTAGVGINMELLNQEKAG